MNFDDIARRTGLVRNGLRFIHEGTQQQFVLAPAGAFVMGMSAAEVRQALREVRYDPDVPFWRDAHARWYAAAQPLHVVTIQPFLVGRSPLLGAAAERAGVDWSTHETAEHRGKTAAAAMSAEAAMVALAHYGWTLPSEAQWEYVARAGGSETWAGGAGFRDAIETQIFDPRFTESPTQSNGWGVWGLGLGEWITDAWHHDYHGAPDDGSTWREKPGPPTTYRGGGVLHAPWQSSDEAMSCHAARRGGPGAWRGMFVARPIVMLPWLEIEIARPDVPLSVPFDEAVAALESELRAERTRKQQANEATHARMARLRTELPGSIQEGIVRSVGRDGTYIVRLPEVNGILRLAAGAAPLEPGDEVTVRITGTGGVPEVELVSRPEGE